MSENDIALTQIKIHNAFTISDGTNSSVFTTDDAVYSPTTFAAKLNTDLGYAENTITVGGDDNTTDNTPYYRIYLQFANAVTLTGMPKYIFNIPFSNFSVKAGGQVNFRNVNLDAEMTFNSTTPEIPQAQIGEDILGSVAGEKAFFNVKLNNDGTIFFTSSPSNPSSAGRVISYEYKIPTSAEWADQNQNIIKGSDSVLTEPVSGKYYWTQRGADITGYQVDSDFGNAIDIDDTGNFIVLSAAREHGNINNSIVEKSGTLRVFEYKIPTSVEWGATNPNAVMKGSDASQVLDKYYWTIVGKVISGDKKDEYWGRGVAINGDGSRICWGTKSYDTTEDTYKESGRVKVYQRDLSNTTTGWTQLGSTLYKEPFDFEPGGYSQSLRLNDAGDVILIVDQYYRYTISGTTYLNVGKAWVYKYKIPTTAEWNDTNSLFVMKDGDSNQVTDKLYWTTIGVFIPGIIKGTVIYGEGYDMNKTGSIIALTGRYTDDGVQKGQLEVFEYTGDISWNQIAYITGTGYNPTQNQNDNLQEGISGGSGRILHFNGARIAMNPTGNIIVLSATEAWDFDDGGVDKRGITGIIKYDGTTWQYIGNDIKGLNANDKLGISNSIGGNKVVLGSYLYDDGTSTDIGMAQVYQIEESAVSYTSTLSAGNYFINDFVSKLDTDISSYSLSYDEPNNRITFDGVTSDISFSITSTDTTVFDTSITEMTSSTNTLPFITYGQPEPNYSIEGLVFIDNAQIKIHDAFTISDGTNSSVFTIADDVYSPTTFAAKLNTDLGYAENTITVGGDDNTTDNTPYYRIYLQFANAVTLTGMPKYIFDIPFSNFSVKAGGQVNFRNVNLDAEMTFNFTTPDIPQAQIGENILGSDAGEQSSYNVKLNNDGTIFFTSSPEYAVDVTVVGRVIAYEYKIPTNDEWTDSNIIIVKGIDSTQVLNKYYWTQRGADIIGNGDLFGQAFDIDDTGNFIVVASRTENGIISNSTVSKTGALRVYEYKIPTGTEWDTTNSVMKGSDASQVLDKYYWTIVGNVIYGDNDNEQWGRGVAMNGDGSRICWGTRNFDTTEDTYKESGRVKVYQRDLSNTTTGWTQLGSTLYKEPFASGIDNDPGGYGDNLRLNDAGDVILVGDKGYRYNISGSNTLSTGKAWVYKYKIPTTAEWDNSSNSLFVMKGDDSNPVTDKLYWTKIGEFIPGIITSNTLYGEGYDMNKTGSIIALTGRITDNNASKGQLEVFEYTGDISWNQIAYITGTGYNPTENQNDNLQEGISGGSGRISHFNGARIAMNPTGNIIALHTTAKDYDQNLSNLGMIAFMEYKNNEWKYFGNDIKGLNAGDQLGRAIAMGGNNVALGTHLFDLSTNDISLNDIGMAQVYQMEKLGSTNSATITAGNHFINNFVSTIETDLGLTLSYDEPNNRITFDGLTTDISLSITSTDTTVFDTSITEITTTANTLPFLSYGQPEPNYSIEGLVFIDNAQIKIHDAFTISDGTNSSIFTTDDAVYNPTTFAAKLNTDLGYAENTITVGGDGNTTDNTPYYRIYLQFANAVTLTGMPKYIFNIPFSNFSVKAGGQVNFRNVNLDAEMTFNFTTPEIPQSQIGEDMLPITGSGNYAYSISINKDGTIISVGDNTYDSGKGIVLVYKYKIPTTTEWATTDIVMKGSDSGSSDPVPGKLYWTQRGSRIVGEVDPSAGEGKLNDSGNIIAIASPSGAGVLKVYEYINDDWSQVGNSIVAPNNEGNGNPAYGNGNALRINGDGTIVAWASKVTGVSRSRAYQYKIPTTTEWNTKDDTTDIVMKGTDTSQVTGKFYWTQLGNAMLSNDDTSGYSSEAFAMNNSGYVIAAGALYTNFNNINDVGEVFVYEYSNGSWIRIGNLKPNGSYEKMYFGQTVQLNAAGDILAVGAQKDDSGSGKGMVKVYQYSVSSTTWNEIAYIQEDNVSKFGRRVALNPSGTILIASSRNYSNSKGLIRCYQYTGSDASWNQIGSDISGDTDGDEFGFGIEIRGSKFIASNYIYTTPVYRARVYQIEEQAVSYTSTLSAGNYFINDFVSKLDTDISSYSLSYDEPNKRITFDGVTSDISLSITSTDTTVFDTSITEMTSSTNTLPFITYGQPDPTIAQYIENGITVNEYINNGYTVSLLLAGGFVPDWTFVTDANQFDQSYVKGFVDVSGPMVIRNDSNLIVNGNASVNNIEPVASTNNMTLQSNLFIGEDISANGNVYIGGDLSVNGQFNGNFANNIIPLSAIISSGGGDIVIGGNVLFAGDVSFNGPTVEVNNTLLVNQIEFSNDSTVSTYDDNILSGTFAGGDVIFKDSTFVSVICEGTASAGTVTQSSDYRIKQNVTELNKTDTVDELLPIQYNNTLSGNHEFGLIAHELQKVYPELVVGEKDGAEYQRVHYNGLIGVLVKEVQELKQRFDALETRP